MTEHIKDICNWIDIAKPDPTVEDISVQTGVHYEEVSEMSSVLVDGSVVKSLDEAAERYKRKHLDYIKVLNVVIDDEDSLIEFLDSLCDQIVTATVLGHMLGFDMDGALEEVRKSNWSKYTDGVPSYDENGKIAKPETAFKPQLKPFIKRK